MWDFLIISAMFVEIKYVPVILFKEINLINLGWSGLQLNIKFQEIRSQNHSHILYLGCSSREFEICIACVIFLFCEVMFLEFTIVVIELCLFKH